ncbi:MAG: glycosyltransferase family 4 protein [Actinomycetia bacterium]|nr:glycosyltransferase family 4 protein [Actinomycetes bacterium]
MKNDAAASREKYTVSDQKTNICLVAPKPPPYGGIANWTLLVLKQAECRADTDIRVVDTAPRWRRIENVSTVTRVVGGGLQLVRDVVRCWRILKTHPNVLHLTSSGGLAIVRDLGVVALAHARGIASVYHLRYGRVPKIARDGGVEWRALTRVIRSTEMVLTVDPTTARLLEQRFPDAKIAHIPNGVDFDSLPPVGPVSGARTVLFLGWVIPTKGVEELVQAWKAVGAQDVDCLIAGPGSEAYRDELRRRFSPDRLEFLGEQSHEDALRLIAGCEVFVLPSYSEGFPNVILEAMALGKPIIATAVGAIPEMLSGNCGLVVPPHDVAALSDAIGRVLSNPEMANDMGARAKEKARAEYGMEQVFDQLVAVWRAVGLSGGAEC